MWRGADSVLWAGSSWENCAFRYLSTSLSEHLDNNDLIFDFLV